MEIQCSTEMMWRFAVLAGSMMMPLWWSVMTIEWLIRRGWQWVDDGQEPTPSWVEHWLMVRVLKYERIDDDLYKYRKNGDWSDGGVQVWFGIFVVLMPIPLLLLLFYLFPWIPALLGMLALVLLISRALRRLLKRFDAHEKDKSAHQ